MSLEVCRSGSVKSRRTGMGNYRSTGMEYYRGMF